ncbi:hypothetical protein AY555_09750 [Haematospirillum jordaniae]|uniref:Uncharacterized protein n=1 Tax=Haematospirillum jordaniae TaxID=1549855 RepID=A0A143DF83_9PROT|nr:hypothetical protein AY555_09750 [Haematospirillum jordaniae]
MQEITKKPGAADVAGSPVRYASGADGYSLVLEQLNKLAVCCHFAHDITAADEFPLDVQLGDGRPVAEFLDALAKFVAVQNIDTFEINAEVTENLNDSSGKTALRKVWGPFHEQNDGVLVDVALDVLENRMI